MATEKNSTELYFEWWLDELKSQNLVKKYEREPQSIVIKESYPIFYNQHYKKQEPIIRNFNLFQPITYTPDYLVVFDKSLLNKLFGYIKKSDLDNSHILEDFEKSEIKPGNVYSETLFYSTNKIKKGEFLGDYIIYFDVKPPSSVLQFTGNLQSSRDFPLKSRMIFDRYGVYINKVIPVGQKTDLFAKTFLPERFRYTDKSGQVRKLKPYQESCKTINEYLQSKNLL